MHRYLSLVSHKWITAECLQRTYTGFAHGMTKSTHILNPAPLLPNKLVIVSIAISQYIAPRNLASFKEQKIFTTLSVMNCKILMESDTNNNVI